MLNSVALIGRISKMPEKVFDQEGNMVYLLEIEVEKPFSSNTDKQVNDFIPVQLWRGMSDLTAENGKIGMIVGIKGRMESCLLYDSYKEKACGIHVVAEKVSFLSGK